MFKERRFLIALLAVVVLIAASATGVWAWYINNPPPLGNWTHPPAGGSTGDTGHGLALSGANIARSSPVMAEIDGNVSNGKEVALAGTDGRLYVYRADGTKLWEKQVYVGCTAPIGDGLINSAPAVGKLDGVNIFVVVSYGTSLSWKTEGGCPDGGVVVYDSAGNENWRFSLSAWRISQGYAVESSYGVISSPGLADVNGDGNLEIGFGGNDRNIYLLNHDGTVRWYFHAADSVKSSPAFMDINSDGSLEMIIGSDISANPDPSYNTNDGGFVYAFDTRDRYGARIDFLQGNSLYVWRTFFDQVIYSSPVIAEVLSDNPGPEIIVGSGCYFPAGSFDKLGKWIKILRPRDGAVLQTLNTGTNCVQSSPALGDIDDDNVLEIVANVRGSPNGSNTDYVNGQVMAWDATNPTPKWSTIPRDTLGGANNAYLDDFTSPVIADLDGNGSLEVLVANDASVVVLNGKFGQQMTCNGSSCGTDVSLYAWGGLNSTPVVGDINNDGELEVLIGGSHTQINKNSTGVFYAWKGFKSMASPWDVGTVYTGTQSAYSAPWPMFRGNAQHTGNPFPYVTASQTSIYLTHQTGDATNEVLTLWVKNLGGSSYSWTITPPANVSVSPASGTVITQSTVTVTVTVASYYQTPGTYPLGNLRLTGTTGGRVVAGSPVTIPVTLVVGQFTKVYLPLVER